jgi:membrane associated rhomboid family serine protease
MQTRGIPPVVLNLLIINILVYIFHLVTFSSYPNIYNDIFSLHKSNFLGFRLVDMQGFYVLQDDSGQIQRIDSSTAFNPIQLVLHFFTHSINSFFHILVNMYMLYSFGPLVEYAMGSQRFLKFYLFAGFVGGIFLAFLDPSSVPVVGASGALSGVFVAFAYLYPNERLIIFPIPIPIRARNFALGLATVSVLLIIFMPNTGGVSHFGHVAGMFAAVIFYKIERFLP